MQDTLQSKSPVRDKTTFSFHCHLPENGGLFSLGGWVEKRGKQTLALMSWLMRGQQVTHIVQQKQLTGLQGQKRNVWIHTIKEPSYLKKKSLNYLSHPWETWKITPPNWLIQSQPYITPSQVPTGDFKKRGKDNKTVVYVFSQWADLNTLKL